jgi:hypothetical protein
MRSRFLAALATLSILAIPATVYAADQVGKPGTANKVEINTPSADAYLQYHGRVFIQVGKTSTEYRWGGTSCGTKTLSDDQVELLVGAVRDSRSVSVQPRYQAGQGSAKCLVGFTIQD